MRWRSVSQGSLPAVLGNAMPKSGSHLIIQVLQGLTGLGPFVNRGFPPVNRGEDNSKLPEKAILANIQRMQPGDIAYGYLKAQEPFISALTAPGRASVFVYRDPRDMIVSHVFYATQMHTGHWMHRYYTETLHTMEERINAAIQGVDEDGTELSDIRTKYLAYTGWLEQPQVLCLRFEDLILDRASSPGEPARLPGATRLHTASRSSPGNPRSVGGDQAQKIRHVPQGSARQLARALHLDQQGLVQRTGGRSAPAPGVRTG